MFLSTIFSGKLYKPFISTSRNKTTAFAMVLRINRRSATPENFRSAARASGCFDGGRHRARGLLGGGRQSNREGHGRSEEGWRVGRRKQEEGGS